MLIATMVVALGAGAFLIWGHASSAETEAAAQKAQAAAEDKPDAATMAKIEATTRAAAALGPISRHLYLPYPSRILRRRVLCRP